MRRGLRTVFVTHTHPSDQHVSGLRMAQFAKCLSEKGNKVAIITPPPRDKGRASALNTSLSDHDWTLPFVYICEPQPNPMLNAARSGALPWGVRQVVLASYFAFHGSVFVDWSNGAISQSRNWLSEFDLNVVYSTFGNTGNWRVAQSIADQFGVPWVADLKDNFEVFIPRPFRRWTASRFGDMAHMTAFSYAHKDQADKFFSVDKTVIYSGHDGSADAGQSMVAEPYELLVIGSLYADDALAQLIDGVRTWAEGQASDGRNKPILKYAGREGDHFIHATRAIHGIIDCKDLGYLELAEMMRHAAKSLANIYVVNPMSMFQHKVFEFLAAGRPIITIPRESNEAERVVKQAGGCLIGCHTAAEFADALKRAETLSQMPGTIDISDYTWGAQATTLSDILHDVVGRAR